MKIKKIFKKLHEYMVTLFTKYSLFILSDSGLGLLGAIENSISRAKMDHYRKNFNKCGEKLRIQFPIVITHPESVVIGNNVSFAAFVHMWGKGGIRIGDKVMIGAHTTISSLTHDYNSENMHKTLIERPVIIEDNVWIGSNCVIMPGVHICQGAVIGAGSIVTRNVSANSIVHGAPAKHEKYRK